MSKSSKTSPKFSSGGLRFDTGKPRVELLDIDALFGTVAVLTDGAAKYADRNWEKGMLWSKVYGPLLRHAFKWWNGEDYDLESGRLHVDHMACNVMFLQAYVKRAVGTDDRPRQQRQQRPSRRESRRHGRRNTPATGTRNDERARS